MTGDAGQPPLLSPAAIAIHNAGDMAGETGGIEVGGEGFHGFLGVRGDRGQGILNSQF